MNISYNWLKDYLNISQTPEEVAAALTSIGLETGGRDDLFIQRNCAERLYGTAPIRFVWWSKI